MDEQDRTFQALKRIPFDEAKEIWDKVRNSEHDRLTAERYKRVGACKRDKGYVESLNEINVTAELTANAAIADLGWTPRDFKERYYSRIAGLCPKKGNV